MELYCGGGWWGCVDSTVNNGYPMIQRSEAVNLKRLLNIQVR